MLAKLHVGAPRTERNRRRGDQQRVGGVVAVLLAHERGIVGAESAGFHERTGRGVSGRMHQTEDMAQLMGKVVEVDGKIGVVGDDLRVGRTAGVTGASPVDSYRVADLHEIDFDGIRIVVRRFNARFFGRGKDSVVIVADIDRGKEVEIYTAPIPHFN